MLRVVWQALNCLSIHARYCVIIVGASPGEGVECRWVRQKTRFLKNSWLYSMYWTAYLRCNAYWGYFSAISVSICTKLARSILMRNRNNGTQPNFQKSVSKSRILSPKNSCLWVFFTVPATCSSAAVWKWRHGNLRNGLRDTQIKQSDVLLLSSCVKLVIKRSCRLHCGRG